MAWNLTDTMRAGRGGEGGVVEILEQGRREARQVQMTIWMREDEDMLNVAMWRVGVNKSWCKFDNYPQLYLAGDQLQRDLYKDVKWFPGGVPLVFYSSHAAKDF